MRTAGVPLRPPWVPAAWEEADGQKARLQGEGERIAMEEYLEFLRGKIRVAPETGFEVDPAQVNPALKPHQRDAVIWACRGGRRALFESFGLGKTAQELEWCRLTAAHEGGQALIVLPLGVRQEFKIGRAHV